MRFLIQPERRFLLACLLTLLSAGSGRCQTAYPLPGAGATATVPVEGVPLQTSAPVASLLGDLHWDFGVVDALRTDHVEHTFTLKNTTRAAVSISRLRGSCGCETLFLAKDGAEATTATLKPGEQAQMRISVRLNPSQGGEMHKFAWAYGPDAAAPLASVEMAITVRPAILFTPDVLDFGEVPTGNTKSVSLTVTADTDVLAGGTLPGFVCTDPGVAVVPDGPEQPAVRDGKPSRTRRYRLTLTAPVSAGSVSGEIQPAPGAPQALALFRLPVVGRVSGGMSAQPRAVFFGSIPAGQGMTREVVLTVGPAEQGQPLSVVCGSPWLTARITDTDTLEVSLKKDAPVGAIQSTVTLRSAAGEQLSLPIVGEVLKE